MVDGVDLLPLKHAVLLHVFSCAVKMSQKQVQARAEASLAARDELRKFKHDPVQDVHLLPALLPLSGSEVTEGIHLLLICLVIAPLHITTLWVQNCKQGVAQSHPFYMCCALS